ncbi:MAG: hypothetical protein FDZ70_01395 [Actinobacteria bacterium]|nr:MAG: hypothetical protein FDZ70_01395 [Actinomycetota bacterium]
MNMHRCLICGETFLGYDAPSNCPFCGAHVEFFTTPDGYPDGLNDVDLTETERADLEASVQVELSNARFYAGMAERKDNDTLRSAYKRLSRIEAEHCSLFCKLLKTAKPADLMTPGETTGSWETDIADSVVRETRAKGLYDEFAARATNARIRGVFEAISAVEADHLVLDEVAKDYL